MVKDYTCKWWCRPYTYCHMYIPMLFWTSLYSPARLFKMMNISLWIDHLLVVFSIQCVLISQYKNVYKTYTKLQMLNRLQSIFVLMCFFILKKSWMMKLEQYFVLRTQSSTYSSLGIKFYTVLYSSLRIHFAH